MDIYEILLAMKFIDHERRKHILDPDVKKNIVQYALIVMYGQGGLGP